MSDLKFSIKEIKKYIMSQDSMGDIMYNLSEDSIMEANATYCPECELETSQTMLDVFNGVCDICSEHKRK
jgi:predicted  nucleic acid-binding Zn ribbon protein